jgi:hypothetical protein
MSNIAVSENKNSKQQKQKKAKNKNKIKQVKKNDFELRKDESNIVFMRKF